MPEPSGITPSTGPQRAGSSTGATDPELSGVELLLNEPEIVAWLGEEAPERD